MKKCEILKCKELIANKECLISKIDLSDKIKEGNVIKLSCGHCFYYPSFIKSYTINNANLFSYRKCPYCLQRISKVPLIIKKKIYYVNK